MGNKKFDGMFLIICFLIIGAFVFFLPSFSMKFNDNDTLKEEKIPTKYTCILKKKEDNYNLNQEATYNIENKKIVSVSIKRSYTFKSLNDYLEFKNENTDIKNIKGENITFKYFLDTLTIEKDIERNILEMDSSDIESTFPRTYDNMLIYTSEQECSSIYE